MFSDSEQSSFAELSSSSDEDQGEDDVEEIHGQIMPYEGESLADSEVDSESVNNKDRVQDGLALAVREARYEMEIEVSSD